MGAEHLVPLSARAADAVRTQQAGAARETPGGTPWLFPSARDPRLPVAYSTLRGVFNTWQEHIGLHDEAGRPVHVTLHQLRHTFGTRLINSGVPQHVIQRLLCHASPEMTNFYAHLHDTTIRAEFERYCQTRVDIDGKLLAFDPGAATADAEWVKHRLSRAADTLPNGYCGRPPQQDCPHPNACLTCPDFQTTAEFLPIHRQHARQARALLADAEAASRERLAANHRKVLISLDKIIASLEHCAAEQETTMPDRIQALRQAAQARHEQTLRRAEAALNSLASHGRPVTVRGVADTARVSRSWIYQQPRLLAEIDRLRQPGPGKGPGDPASQKATVGSLRQQLHAYREEITRLRAEITSLRGQLARQLGTARTAEMTRQDNSRPGHVHDTTTLRTSRDPLAPLQRTPIRNGW